MALGGTILVSDKKARLKPCLRCGYSLIHLGDARKCPECGLAVRISLSDNRSLAWSNPRLQRFEAAASGIMVLGFACTILSSAEDWAYWALEDYYFRFADALYFVTQASEIARALGLFLCGLGVCLLTRSEGRYPDPSVVIRRVVRGVAIAIMLLAFAQLGLRYGLADRLPSWGWWLLTRALSGPWLPFIFAVLVSANAHDIGKRGDSRQLLKMSQVATLPVPIGFWVWLLNVHRFFRPLRWIIWDNVFPLSMIIVLVMTIRVYLRNAREAEANWASET